MKKREELLASRKLPRDPKLWVETLAQVEKGWPEGQYALSRDVALQLPAEEPSCNPAFRFGVL